MQLPKPNIDSLFDRISLSTRELKDVRSLTGGALLAALNVVINQFTIFFSQVLRLGFSFLTVGVSGMLYGPVLTGTIGVVTDILKFIFHSDGSAFFPGFTLNEFLLGFIYGAFFYRKAVTLPRVIAAKLTAMVVINLFLTPLWLSMLYGQAFVALVAARLLKNLIMFPIETAMLYFVLKKVRELRPARLGQ